MVCSVGFGDLSRIKGEAEKGGLCPIMTYCKIAPDDFDILIPDGHFVQAVRGGARGKGATPSLMAASFRQAARG